MYEANSTDPPLCQKSSPLLSEGPLSYSNGGSENLNRICSPPRIQYPIVSPDGAYTSRLTPPASKTFNRILDILFVLPAFIFLIFAALCISLHKKEVDKSPYGLFLLQAAKVGPTLFPITFALVIGGTSTMVARLILEKGGKLGVIEQLHSSDTLGKTLSTVFKLRSWTILSLLLVLVWSLSPLGGQASLRILQTTMLGTSAATDIYYMPGNMTNSYSLDDFTVPLRPVFRALFLSSILAIKADRNASMDMWGNVRVPFLQSLDAFSGDWTNSSWIKVPENFDDYLYESLIGVPIVGFTIENGSADPRATETHFQMETDYIHLTCPTITPTAKNWNYTSPNGTTWACSNNEPTVLHDTINNYFFGYQSAYTMNPPNFDIPTFNPYTLRFYIRYMQKESQATINCTLYQRFVESEVTCKGRNCTITSLRPSKTPHNLEKEGYNGIDCQKAKTLYNFLSEFINSTSLGFAEYPPLWLFYLMNYNNPLLGYTGDYPDLRTLSPRQFELRMSQLLNTFWKAGIGTAFRMATAPTVHQLETDPLPTGSYEALQFTYAKVPGESTTYQKVYIYEVGWLIALVLCSLAMVIAGGIMITLGFTLYSPDILGYVSSLMRDNAWCMKDGAGLAGVGSTLDGDIKSRLLKDQRIKLGDVRRGESDGIGYIGLIWEDKLQEQEANMENRGLDKTKFYS